MHIQLSEHFTYKKLLRFSLPSIVMVLFTSLYSIVDGLFVSNYAGKTAFAAVNLIMPLPIAMGAIGFMIGTGGSAIVAKYMGKGEKKKANEYFSMLVKVTVIGGLFLTVIGFLLVKPVAVKLGATGKLLELCVIYGKTLQISLVFYLLMNVFHSFFITAQKPHLGLVVTIFAGIMNVILDFIMVGILNMGVMGAGIATAISEITGGSIGLVYFLKKNNSLLRIGKSRFYPKVLLKTITNGSSELLSNLSESVVTTLYNFRLMHLAGENGIAAYGAIMYVNFVFVSVFFGFSLASSPIVSYHYGANNTDELKSLFKKSIVIMSAFGLLMMISAQLLSGILSKIFVGYDYSLYNMTTNGFKIYATSFLICGINIFASGFFTALNNGYVSAVISFLRTLVFQSAVVLILPEFFALNGIWSSKTLAKILALFLSLYFFISRKKKYNYL